MSFMLVRRHLFSIRVEAYVLDTNLSLEHGGQFLCPLVLGVENSFFVGTVDAGNGFFDVEQHAGVGR